MGKQTFHPSFLTPKNQMKFKSTPTSVSIAYKRHTSFIMPHPTNNHAPLPSFLELFLEDAKAEDVQRPLWPPYDLQRAGVDDGAFFKAARRTGLDAPSAFSRERESWKKEPSSKCVVLLEVLPRFIKIATNESFM